MSGPEDYLWIVVLGGFLAVFCSYGIGANDVANAFATSVGSKTITMKQAVIFAAFWEFAGAVLLGSHVTKTISSGIADPHCFQNDPEILMYGMMCVIFTTGIWLIFATLFELPVSTTHSTVGGIIGMVLVAKGSSCVNWYSPSPVFPFAKGVVAIIISWFLSPILSAAIGMTLFASIRRFVLRADNSYKKSLFIYPFLLFLTVVLNIFFVIYKGAVGLGLNQTPLKVALAFSFGIGVLITIIVSPIYIPWLKKSIDQSYIENVDSSGKITFVKVEQKTKKGFQNFTSPEDQTETFDWDLETKDLQNIHLNDLAESAKPSHNIAQQLQIGVKHETRTSVEKNNEVEKIHSAAEIFDPKSEEVFKWLQVFTACMNSFAHGANDVANSIGPFAAIYMVYKNNGISKDNELGSNAYWILALGGFGIVLGLSTLGYKIIYAMGVKMTPVTPARGFCIEVASTFTIVMGSRFQLPLSSTHCQVGSTMGVGGIESCRQLNWNLLVKVFAGWLVTLLVTGASSAIVFAQGVYSPTLR